MNSQSEEDLPIIEYLIKNGADIEAENEIGATPLCLAAEADNLAAINILVFYGADVNHALKSGKFEGGTALHFAAASNASLETIEVLIGLGTNVNLKDWRGRLPLHWAAREGKLDVMIKLLELSGGDMYLRDNGELTLLHLAAAVGNEETAKWLIKKGFQIEVKENTG